MLDPEWLKGRQTLFEKFCLPSVLSQTNKDFEWILVADERTPEEFKKVIEAYPATVVYGDFAWYEPRLFSPPTGGRSVIILVDGIESLLGL